MKRNGHPRLFPVGWSVDLDTAFDLFDEVVIQSVDPSPPRLDAGTAESDAWAAIYRTKGYLDCLDGLVQDGYPDEKFVAYLCEQVDRSVPPRFFDRVMDENAKLRRRILALERKYER